jgi:hypothetical protein
MLIIIHHIYTVNPWPKLRGNAFEYLSTIFADDARLCHGINSKGKYAEGKLFVAFFVFVKTVKRLP